MTAMTLGLYLLLHIPKKNTKKFLLVAPEEAEETFPS
jgi:hypothetical protein